MLVLIKFVWRFRLRFLLIAVFFQIYPAIFPVDKSHRYWLDPCESLYSADREDLELQKRETEVLNLDVWPVEKSGFPIVRFLVNPSFGSDRVVSIYRPDDGNCVIVSTFAKRNIYYANTTMKNDYIVLKKKPEKINKTTYKKIISCELAKFVEKVWQESIKNIQIPKPNTDGNFTVTMDGVSYRAISWKKFAGNLCGETHSPPEGTPARKLVRIGESLFEFSKVDEGDEKAIVEKIEKQGNDLLEKIKSNFE